MEKSPAKAARYIFSGLIINSTNIYEKPTYTSEQEKPHAIKILYSTGDYLLTIIKQIYKTIQVVIIAMKKTRQCKIIENVMGGESILERKVSRDLNCGVELVKILGNSILGLEKKKGRFLKLGLFEEEQND